MVDDDWHRLTDVDSQKRIAVCSVCGPVDIKVLQKGKGHECMTRVRAQQKQKRRRLRDRGIDRNKNRRYVDGRTRAEQLVVIKEQGGRCAICGYETRLVGDHCHKSNKSRGMLCLKCNFLIGQAQDDVAILQAAIRYLEDHAKRSASLSKE